MKVENDSMEECIKIVDKKPLISVIMPVYNAEKYLKGSISSLLKQTYKNLEIICINDGSTDHSLDILNQFAINDERIKIIDQENGGPAKARNSGLDAATGKYISFVDADDFVEKEMYESLVRSASKKDADIVVFGGTPYPNKNAPKWIWEKLSPRAVTYEGVNVGAEAIFSEKSSTPFLWIHFIKRDILELPTQIRFSEQIELGEDQIFQFMYFPRAKRIVYIEDRFYFYRWENEGSLMWKYNHMQTEKFRTHLKVVETIFERWNELGYCDQYGNFASWMVGFLYYDLIKFPKYLQIEFARRILAIADSYKVKLYMCSEYEFEHGKEIEQLAAEDENSEENMREEIDSLKDEIQKVEEEIQGRIHSKSFKLGRMLTCKRKRLDLSSVQPPERKKN